MLRCNDNINDLVLPVPTHSDILQIENLWQFTNLRKLQLDNNIIEKIVGLDTLIHLQWLGTQIHFHNNTITLATCEFTFQMCWFAYVYRPHSWHCFISC